jgi:hypothetical protein
MDLARGAARRPAHRLAAAVAALTLAAAGCTAAIRTTSGPATTLEGTPRFLQGRPLAGPTGLRLLVASDPPRVLDVDRGTSRPVGGLPNGQDPFGVARLGEGALIAGDREAFVLDRGSSRARSIGQAVTAVASRDGRGVWLLEPGRACILREVDLRGRDRRPPRRLPCGTGVGSETSLGLLGWTGGGDGERQALLDPGTGRVVASYPAILGVAGSLVLWGANPDDGGPFTLTDRRTGARHRVARPTPDAWAGSGLPSPDGRLLAVEFVDASWSRVKGQVSDIWRLDLRGRRWRRLPGAPLITAVKFMSMAWTGDGRLVLVGDFDRFGEALAVWRPGQDHLAVRRLDLPAYDGSDSFAVWPAARPRAGVARRG